MYKKNKTTVVAATNSNFEDPEISIVLPVFNQELIISDVIHGIVKSMTLPFELIVIDDASEDESLKEILCTCQEEYTHRLSNFLGYSIYQNSKSQFETYCDAFGFSKSKGKYLLELQSDMIVDDYGFDQRLADAMILFPNLFAISGRGTEPMDAISRDFVRNYEKFSNQTFVLLRLFVNHIKEAVKELRILGMKKTSNNEVSSENESLFIESKDFDIKGHAGRLGRDLFKKYSSKDLGKKLIYFGDTIMRGPLFIRKGMYVQIGGLNTDAFFLGFDDHDLFSRARIEKNWRVAYSPISFNSPVEMGSTRKFRSLKQKIAFYRASRRVYNNYTQSTLYSLGVGKLTWEKNLWFVKEF